MHHSPPPMCTTIHGSTDWRFAVDAEMHNYSWSAIDGLHRMRGKHWDIAALGGYSYPNFYWVNGAI